MLVVEVYVSRELNTGLAYPRETATRPTRKLSARTLILPRAGEAQSKAM
jgi:hypothetical protein